MDCSAVATKVIRFVGISLIYQSPWIGAFSDVAKSPNPRRLIMVLKVNLHCSACERKIHKVIKKIDGVSSIELDGENGKVTVTGNVDPCTVISLLEKAGKKAELLWLYTSTPNPNPNPNPTNCTKIHCPQNSAPAQVGSVPSMDPAQMAQLHQLSQVKNLKQVELTHSKSIKVKFNSNGSDDPAQQNETHTTKKIMVDANGAHLSATSGPGQIANGHYHHHLHHHHWYRPSRPGGVPHEYFNGCEPPPTCNRRGLGPPPEARPATAYPYPNAYSANNPSDCKLM